MSTHKLVRIKSHYHFAGEVCHHKGRPKASISPKMPLTAPKKRKSTQSRTIAIGLVLWAICATVSAPFLIAQADTETFTQPTQEETQYIGITSMAQVSGYSSEIAQTDSTPFHSADGTHVYDGMIANNCLPFGTLVIIEGKTYQVHDRMNKRYTKNCNYDIWFDNKQDALDWGRKNVEVTVVK
jgi:3D (Asp-Asp-Asp) domain-containing protein